MLNIINNQKNANDNCNETPIHTIRMAKIKKLTLTIPCVAKYVEKLEFSVRNVNGTTILRNSLGSHFKHSLSVIPLFNI